MTLVYYIYNVAFVNTPKYGYASAIAWCCSYWC